VVKKLEDACTRPQVFPPPKRKEENFYCLRDEVHALFGQESILREALALEKSARRQGIPSGGAAAAVSGGPGVCLGVGDPRAFDAALEAKRAKQGARALLEDLRRLLEGPGGRGADVYPDTDRVDAVRARADAVPVRGAASSTRPRSPE